MIKMKKKMLQQRAPISNGATNIKTRENGHIQKDRTPVLLQRYGKCKL